MENDSQSPNDSRSDELKLSAARHVMVAAGRSPRIVENLPAKYRDQLAALCGVGGQIPPAVRDKVITILRAAGQENKATIDGVEDES